MRWLKKFRVTTDAREIKTYNERRRPSQPIICVLCRGSYRDTAALIQHHNRGECKST